MNNRKDRLRKRRRARQIKDALRKMDESMKQKIGYYYCKVRDSL